jgi:hypothetical protein
VAKKAGSGWVDCLPLSEPMPHFRYYLNRCALPLMMAVALAGCERREPRVYFASKEQPEQPEARPEADPHGAQAESPAMPRVSGVLPAGWKDLGPDERNVARFEVGAATVNVTPLGLPPEKELYLVNVMRELFGQTALTPAEAAKALVDVPIAGAMGKLFDFTGEQGKGDAAKTKTRIVTGIFYRENTSWLFKLQGPPEAVEGQLAAFKEFLTTVKFEAPAPKDPASASAPTPAPAVAVTPPDGAPEVPGKTPEGWAPVAPGPMQAAKFTVPEKDGAKAEVTVSIFPNDTGGNVGNIRRWRGQLGLPDADDAAIQASLKPLEGGPAGAIYVELENAGRALTGAIVPRDGRWYFYKLMGKTPAVAAARESFMVFARGQ